MDTTYQFITRFFKSMRSIEANYKKIQVRNPNLGDYLCLARAIKGKKFSRKSLVKSFTELVSKDDYLKSERKELVDYLEYLTNIAEEGEIRVKN